MDSNMSTYPQEKKFSKEQFESIAETLTEKTGFKWYVVTADFNNKKLIDGKKVKSEMTERSILAADFISYDVTRDNKFIEYVNKNKITFKKDEEGNIDKEDVRGHLKNFFQSMDVPIESSDLKKQYSTLDTFFDIKIYDDGFRNMSNFIKYINFENLNKNASLLHELRTTNPATFFKPSPTNVAHKILSSTVEKEDQISQDEIDKTSGPCLGYPVQKQ